MKNSKASPIPKSFEKKYKTVQEIKQAINRRIAKIRVLPDQIRESKYGSKQWEEFKADLEKSRQEYEALHNLQDLRLRQTQTTLF